MVVRSVKFNIREFIDGYILLHELKDKEGEEALLSDYKSKYLSSNSAVKRGMRNFLKKSELVKDYPTLQKLVDIKY